MVNNRDQGFALVGVLLVTVSLLTVVSGILVYGSTTNKRAVDEESQVRAFYAAESGISHALAKFKAMQEGGTLPETWPASDVDALKNPFVTSVEGVKPQYVAGIYRQGDSSELIIIAQGKDRAILRNVSVNITVPGLGGDGVIGAWPICNYPSTSVTWTGNGTADHSKVTYSDVGIGNGSTEITVANEFYAETLRFVNPNGILKFVGEGPVTVCIKSIVLRWQWQKR
ncbi:MAG: hypothetical protein ACOX44_13860 [Limnochordia bacterium]